MSRASRGATRRQEAFNTPVGSGQYHGRVGSIPRYRRVFRYRGIASLIRPCCVVDTPLLRRRYALVAPLIRPCCVVDTPLLIARFLPLCDTLVRNANRLYGKEAYSHFRACFRLLIAIEHFPFVSHSFPIRFTFGSHLRCLARHHANHRARICGDRAEGDARPLGHPSGIGLSTALGRFECLSAEVRIEPRPRQS